MSLKIEKYLSEVQYAGGINSDLPITTSSTISASNISTLTTGSAGSFVVNGSLTVTGALTATASPGAITVTGSGGLTFGLAGPQIIVGAWNTVAGPTGISAPTGSLFLATNGTGPATRAFLNTNGATGWAAVTTAS